MKKTTVYMLLAVAGIIASISYACSKPDPDYVPLDFTKANLGDLHNEVVRKVYKRYNDNLKRDARNRLGEVPPGNEEAESKEDFIREVAIAELHATPIQAGALGITDEQHYSTAIQIMDDLAANNFDIRNFPTPMCSPPVMVYVREILSTIEAVSSLSEINAALDKIAEKAATELQGIDKDEVSGILKIAEASAYLWSNEDGSDDALGSITGGGKKVIVADVSASASFFLRMGVVGVVFASTPGSNAVILTGWALSAGISSACAGLLSHQYSIPLPRD
jgi:hypothetical protein